MNARVCIYVGPGRWLRESKNAWHGVKLNQPELEHLVAQRGIARGDRAARILRSLDTECVLGAAGFRITGSGSPERRPVAPVD